MRWIRRLLGPAIAVALLAAVYGIILATDNLPWQSGPEDMTPGLAGSMGNFLVHETPRPGPEITFRDAAGEETSLADFRGRTVLLNLWATWCAPCREEMPALDRLQARLGGPHFTVLAVSVDRGGADKVRAFFAEIGIERLGLYIDPSGEAALRAGAIGLPTTLLIGPDGRELGRLIGPAEWDSPEAIAFLRGVLPDADAAS